MQSHPAIAPGRVAIASVIGLAAGDMLENRPALSRWHPHFADAFRAFIAGAR